MESHYKLNEDPVWRGTLVITNETFGSTYGIVAHLPNKVCEKVLEVAQFFPILLYSEVVPKLHVWPKSFTNSPPTDNDIALYFFAAEGYDQLFEGLVCKLTGRDGAFKVLIDKAELLIFTSSQLPEQHQTIEGKSYLWGVLRRNKALTSHHLNNKTKCVMPLNPINAPSSVGTDERAVIKMGNNGADSNNLFEVNLSQSPTEVFLQHGPCENQQLLSDSNHSRNTVNPVLSSPTNNNPTEKALNPASTPTIVPTTNPPAIGTDIIPKKSLSQFQGISRTPIFQQGVGDHCTNSTTKTFTQGITTNLRDMSRIFNGTDSHEAATQSASVKVGKYTVKQSLSSVLESILSKYGDIAQECQLPDESTSYILELICKAIQNIQKLSLNKLRIRHLKYLNTIINEARSVNIEVDWLKNRHDELEENLCMLERYPCLKDDMYKRVKVAETIKVTLGLKKEELVKARSECESMENQLTLLEAEFKKMDSEISNMVSECKQSLEKPLIDGLL